MFAMLAIVLIWLTPGSALADAGRLIEVRLARGPHPPGDAPDVVAHIPAHYDTSQPLDIVVFLHGFDGCSRALVAPTPVPCSKGESPHRVWNLAALHTQSTTNTLLLVPQLAYLARTAQGHRFTAKGAFDDMLRAVLEGELSQVLGARTLGDVRSVSLVAHSAGYGAAVAILRDERRAARVDRVVLLDALYAGWFEFARWFALSPSHRLVSLYTQQQQTTQGNRHLSAAIGESNVRREVAPSLEEALRRDRCIITRVRTAHGDMPRAHFAEVLRGLAATAH